MLVFAGTDAGLLGLSPYLDVPGGGAGHHDGGAGAPTRGAPSPAEGIGARPPSSIPVLDVAKWASGPGAGVGAGGSTGGGSGREAVAPETRGSLLRFPNTELISRQRSGLPL